MFQEFLKMGYHHITELGAYDHILFIISLCAYYRLEQLRNIIILVTAFTIGHSITLALTALSIIEVNRPLIETLIPFTIFITCIFNVTKKEQEIIPKNLNVNYLFAMGFGTIHGMAFAENLKDFMIPGQSLVSTLLAFNIGIELGQLLIVAGYILLLIIGQQAFRIQHRAWNLFISGACAGISLLLILESDFWNTL